MPSAKSSKPTTRSHRALYIKPRWKKYAVACAAAMAAVLAVGAIKVDVPTDLRGTLVAEGRIVHCDFQRIGRRGGEFFMGVTLDTPGVPLLRFNGPSSERSRYEAMCTRQPDVRIAYHAVKRVLGPVRFWIDDLSEV